MRVKTHSLANTTPGRSPGAVSTLQSTPHVQSREPALAPALDCERFAFNGLNCYVAGNGPPLVLVHSVNAAPSAAEVRPIFEHFRATRTVFAIDLPGFGLSTRADLPYDPRLMTDALHALAEHVQRRCGPVPIDALAVSLGCEFLARAAVERPATWGRLALVSPTGLNGTTPHRGPPGSVRTIPWLRAILMSGAWTQGLFGLLTRPAVMRHFLQRTWGSKAIDEPMWAYAVLSARQPGARFAPLCFLSGSLFSKDIHQVYESLSQPVWMSHGVRGDFADFRGMQLLRVGANWHTTVYQTGAMPYFEMPVEFFREMGAFLAGDPGSAASVRSAQAGQTNKG